MAVLWHYWASSQLYTRHGGCAAGVISNRAPLISCTRISQALLQPHNSYKALGLSRDLGRWGTGRFCSQKLETSGGCACRQDPVRSTIKPQSLDEYIQLRGQSYLSLVSNCWPTVENALLLACIRKGKYTASKTLPAAHIGFLPNVSMYLRETTSTANQNGSQLARSCDGGRYYANLNKLAYWTPLRLWNL